MASGCLGPLPVLPVDPLALNSGTTQHSLRLCIGRASELLILRSGAVRRRPVRLLKFGSSWNFRHRPLATRRQGCAAQQQELGTVPRIAGSCQHCGRGFVEQYSLPVFFATGGQSSTTQLLPTLMHARDQLSALAFPLPAADFTAAGFLHTSRISQPSLQLPLLKLPERCRSAPSLSALSICKSAASSDACNCEAVEQQSSRSRPHVTPALVVNSLVSRKQRLHAASCQRLAMAAMLALQLPDTVELETEAAGGGLGSDGCGENGGEGGGASWSSPGAAGEGRDGDTDEESESDESEESEEEFSSDSSDSENEDADKTLPADLQPVSQSLQHEPSFRRSFSAPESDRLCSDLQLV